LKSCGVKFGLCLLLAASVGITSASAQNGERIRERQAARKQAAEQRRSEAGGQKPLNERAAVGLPPKFVEKLRDMPPEEQERFMQNNEKFQSLPPLRQAQIRQNLQKWNALPAEQKERIRATEAMLENATPEQREHFQNYVVPKLEQMPPMRRARVINHWRRLQSLTPAEQQAALRDPGFMGNLSPDEQSVVRDLNSMGNPGAAGQVAPAQ
jgi:Protein of unknown function (DUF3106)